MSSKRYTGSERKGLKYNWTIAQDFYQSVADALSSALAEINVNYRTDQTSSPLPLVIFYVLNNIIIADGKCCCWLVSFLVTLHFLDFSILLLIIHGRHGCLVHRPWHVPGQP